MTATGKTARTPIGHRLARWAREVSVKTVATIIASLVVGFVGGYVVADERPAAAPATAFTSPAEMQSVGSPTVATGTLASADLGKTFWPMVWSHEGGRNWHPQENPAQLQSDFWSATFYIGDDKSMDHKFSLFLIETTPEIEQQIRDYLARGAAMDGSTSGERYPGIPPENFDGLRKVDGPVVIRAR